MHENNGAIASNQTPSLSRNTENVFLLLTLDKV